MADSMLQTMQSPQKQLKETTSSGESMTCLSQNCLKQLKETTSREMFDDVSGKTLRETTKRNYKRIQ